MSEDNQNQDAETQPTEAQTPAEPISDVSIQPNGFTPTNLPSEAPESPINAPSHTCPTKIDRN